MHAEVGSRYGGAAFGIPGVTWHEWNNKVVVTLPYSRLDSGEI